MTVIRTTPDRAKSLKNGIDFLRNYTGQIINSIETGQGIENKPGQPGVAVRAILDSDLQQNGTMRARLLRWNEFACNFVVTVTSQMQFANLSQAGQVTFTLKMTDGDEVVFETDPIFPIATNGGVALSPESIYNAIIATGKVGENHLEVYTSYNTLVDGVVESVNFHVNFKGPFRERAGINLRAIQRQNIWYKLTVFVPQLSRLYYSHYYYVATRDIAAVEGVHGAISEGDLVYPSIYNYNVWGYGYRPNLFTYPWNNYYTNGWISFRQGNPESGEDGAADTSYITLRLRTLDDEPLFITERIRILNDNYVMDIDNERLFQRFSEQGLDGVADEDGVEFAVVIDVQSTYYRSWWICFQGDYGNDNNKFDIFNQENADNAQLVRLAKPWTITTYKSKDEVTNDYINVRDVLRADARPIPAGSVVVAIPFADVEYGIVEASSRFREPPKDVYPYYPDPRYYGNPGYYGWGYGAGIPFPYYPGLPYFGFNAPYGYGPTV